MTTEDWQLLLSAIALILTPILSVLVVRHELKKSHEWWREEQKFLDAREIKEKKYKLYEDCSNLFPKLKAIIKEYQVFWYSKNECQFMIQEKQFSERFTEEFVKSEFERYKLLTIEHHMLLREKLAEQTQNFYLARGYYSTEILKKYESLIAIYEKFLSLVLSYDDMSLSLNNHLGNGLSIDEARQETEKTFNLRFSKIESEIDFSFLLLSMFSENLKK